MWPLTLTFSSTLTKYWPSIFYQNSLTTSKIPWLFTDLEQIYFFLTFSWPVATLQFHGRFACICVYIYGKFIFTLGKNSSKRSLACVIFNPRCRHPDWNVSLFLNRVWGFLPKPFIAWLRVPLLKWGGLQHSCRSPAWWPPFWRPRRTPASSHRTRCPWCEGQLSVTFNKTQLEICRVCRGLYGL